MFGLDTIQVPAGRLPGGSQLGVLLRSAWRRGDRVTALEILSGAPELQCRKSVVLDLAYEEYCARIATGESVNIDRFAARFSSYERSVYRLLEVAQLLNRDPRFATNFGRVEWPEEGEVFLGFQLLECIGRGAFSKVFLATDVTLGGRRVVVKIASGGRAEAEILGSLDHCNVVPVHSVKWDPARALAALCMPYCGRVTFADLIDRLWAVRAPATGAKIEAAIRSEDATSKEPKIFRWLRSASFSTAVIYLFAELAEGLAHAHARGVTHGDLKPSNILLNCQGQPMLLDFNLSRSKEQRSWIGGTLAYMAPEQIMELWCNNETSGSSRQQADIFSIGVILYELLTGRLPFGDLPSDLDTVEVAHELLERHHRSIEPIRSIHPNVDPWLEKMVLKCLERDPDLRLTTAASLARELRAQLLRSRRVCRWVASHKLRAGVFAAVCGTGMALGVTYAAMRPAYELRQLRLAEAAFMQGQYPLATSLADDALHANPKVAGAYYLRAKSSSAQGNFQVALADFKKLQQLNPNPRWLAEEAYCLTMADWHRGAISLYKHALAGGFLTAELYNNLGFSFLQLDNPSDAITALDKAIEMDPKLGVAYRNRALAKMQAARRSNVPTSDDALADIHTALTLGPICGELYLETAIIAATTARQSPEKDSHIIACLKHAIEFGAPNEVLTDSVFARLSETKQFGQLRQLRRRNEVPYAQSLVVNLGWLQVF